MRPHPEKVLGGVVAALSADLPPVISTPFGVATAGHATMLTLVIAHEVDRLADRLHRENEAVKAILRDAAPLLTPAARTAVHEAIAREAPDIRVSSLLAVNDAVRAALVDVHAAVEGIDSPEARTMDARIWEELKESTRRRHVMIPGR
ncbi:MAG: hypothetical protein ACKVVT_12360 [Dehalococcoidia bacterium]